MNAVTSNLINELLEIDQELFTKDDIIKFIKENTQDKTLPTIESNGVILNPERYHVTAEGVNHVIPRREFQLLYYLMENKNKNVTRYAILRDVWGSDVIVSDRTIDVHIRKIRNVLPVNHIRTNKGMGYIWLEK